MLTRKEFLNPILIKNRKGSKMGKTVKTHEELCEIQTYLQMYDKGMLSRKTVLEKVGIDPVKEAEQIEKEKE